MAHEITYNNFEISLVVSVCQISLQIMLLPILIQAVLPEIFEMAHKGCHKISIIVVMLCTYLFAQEFIVQNPKVPVEKSHISWHIFINTKLTFIVNSLEGCTCY